MTTDTKATTFMKITRMKSKIGSIMYTCHASLYTSFKIYHHHFFPRKKKNNFAIFSLRQENPVNIKPLFF